MSDVQFIAVALTPYEWHRLLRDIEWKMNFAGDQSVTRKLYERIASQLSDLPVKVVEAEQVP